jgi:adenosylcobinamide-GDP ribazoletransferase
VRFYSRLPMPKLSPADDRERLPAFAEAVAMLPFAAVVIALPGALALLVLSATELSSPVVAAIALAVTTVVTGAFHEDGFADVADGFGGGGTPERRLEIMKDSRIGAFGGLALAIQFVLRTLLVADLLDARDGPVTAAALVGIAALARAAPLAFMVWLSPARANGLARAVGAPSRTVFAGAVAGAAIVFLIATAATLPLPSVLAALALVVGVVAGLGLTAERAIGGYTGDVIGAGTLFAEIALLIGLCL